MERTIYHGSENIVRKPEFQKGNAHNDYGLGFYCCSNKDLAKEWSARKNGSGFVNCYKIRDDRLRILDLTKPPFDDVLYWVALLMHNRELSNAFKQNYPRELKYLEDKYLIDVSKYDIVIGYRADDSYFHFPEAFVRSDITLASLNAIFKAGDLGKQYVIISERAFKLIRFVDYEMTQYSSKADYYRRKAGADKVFADLLIKDRYSKETRLRDLVIDYE
ncbi:MAG: DUF3990 domain-containing protein [Bacilli bacterium]|nr:DUF3990 domain-containing protein [Bacilli bacterium]